MAAIITEGSSSKSVSGRPVKISYIMWYSFSSKLDVNITALTSVATRVLERLIKAKDLLRKWNCVSLHLKERNTQKINRSC